VFCEGIGITIISNGSIEVRLNIIFCDIENCCFTDTKRTGDLHIDRIYGYGIGVCIERLKRFLCRAICTGYFEK
jgi:hypothetical protein